MPHEITDRREDVLLVDAELSSFLEVVGEDIQEKLGVAVGVDMTMGIGVEELFERGCVDEVTVLLDTDISGETEKWLCGEGILTRMGEDDAVGGVDVEGLRFGVS